MLWPFLTLLHELDNAHPAVMFENKGGAPGPVDGSSSLRLETGDESSISAAELAEDQALEVTAFCCVFGELRRASCRPVLASALVARGGACQKQRLEDVFHEHTFLRV